MHNVYSLSAAFVVAATLLQAGCGLRGPLYHPDEQASEVPEQDQSTQGKKKSAPVVPAPQSQKEDRTDSPPPSDSASAPVPDPDGPATPPPGT